MEIHIYYLNDEYPYLLENDSFKNIIDMFNYMQDTFKTDIWFKGLEIMKEV